jgi:L-arabonate dehydrase
MGAASCDVPAIVVSGGPMLNGHYRDQIVGSGTSAWQLSEDVRAGKISLQAFLEAEAGNARSAGHCMTMGTASTMASMVEALGIALPTNAVIHLLAIAGRIGVDLSLDDWDKLGQNVPCLVNLMPSGKYLMEDFYYAGGLPVVIREIGRFLHKKALTVNGRTIWQNCKDAVNYNADVITPLAKPFKQQGGIAVLRGNLAPRGAVLKPSAATPKLMKHTGRAVVFEDIDDLHRRIDDPELEVDPSSILVLKNCGPKGYPGFPEVGNFALPAKMLKQGVTDMIRISDARMSGTAYGTVVLHTAPEAAAGGPLALVENGDLIEIDVAARKIHLEVTDEELAKRKAKWKSLPPHATRGWVKL